MGAAAKDSDRRIISASVPVTLRAELQRRAERNDRSLSGEVRQALLRYLETKEQQP